MYALMIYVVMISQWERRETSRTATVPYCTSGNRSYTVAPCPLPKKLYYSAKPADVRSALLMSLFLIGVVADHVGVGEYTYA